MRRISVILASLMIISQVASVSFAKTERAISLRAIESAIAAGRPSDAAELCGITIINGFVVDKANRDIILIGTVDPEYPPLHLEDFVVALRNSLLVYAVRKGQTVYYSPPGCSIDPTPEVLKGLQAVSVKMSRSTNEEEFREAVNEWERIGRQPQKVRVMGVPFYSRFAKVMVDADYYMKRLVNGSVDLGIEGFRSLMDLAEEEVSEPMHSLNRFWFCPGDATYDEDGGVVLLVDCPVKLLTEEEFLSEGGARMGSGRENPQAKLFAESFTAKFQEIATVRPIYKELEALFRFVGLVRLMKEQNAFSTAGLNLPYLTRKYNVPTVPVSTQVLGLTRVVESTEETETGILYRRQLSCGGVKMDVRPTRMRIAPKPAAQATTQARVPSAEPTVSSTPRGKPNKPAKSGSRFSKLKEAVLSARTSPAALYWDFSTPE